MRSKTQRFLHLEDLEYRRLLASGELIIGSGNIPSSDRPVVDADIVIAERENKDDPRNVRVTNNTRATAQLLPLGFDTGEFAAVDVRGELIEPNAISIGRSRETGAAGPPVIPPLDDGSIPTATPVNHGSGSPIRFQATLGNSVNFANDADFYELEELEQGQRITAHQSGAPDSVLALYNIFGEVLEVTETNPAIQNFISFVVEEPGDYFIAVVPFNGDMETFRLPIDPNNGATVQGGGGGGAYELTIGVDAVDLDYYAFDLNAGDILGVNGIGSTDVLTLEGPGGERLLRSSSDISINYPLASPLPGGGTASLAYVVDTPGRYYLSVQGFRWHPYKLETRVFRPVLESAPPGTEQIVFLDFDGAELNNSLFDVSPADVREISPLTRFVRRLGLSDESDLISRIVKVVREDFAPLEEFNPNFSIKILNSRDHADPFGQPHVSRVIIGGTSQEAGIAGLLGIAESIDVGNFDTSETVLLPLDEVTGPSNNPNSINHWPVAAGANKADLAALGIGLTISHELAHIFGAFHSDSFSDTVNIIDSGGRALWIDLGIGPDLTWGTHDDEPRDFLRDVFSLQPGEEGIIGVANTPSMLANVLVTGQGGAGTARKMDLQGVVFDDSNGNGVQDTGEAGRSGARVYIDANRDGDFGIGEPTALTDATGRYMISNVAMQDEFELRVVVMPGFQQTAPASGGYLITEDTTETSGFDFGVRLSSGTSGGIDYSDAPASYGVASHLVVPGFSLGAVVDGENGPLQNDGTDDDGVTLSGLVIGETGTGTITVSNGSFSPGVVNGWIDFNRDGVFASSERVVHNLLVSDSTPFSFQVPADAQAGTSWARFRYGYTRDIGPVGTGKVGEVEDYAVSITLPGGGSNEGPNAINDTFQVVQDATEFPLDVLANDAAGSGDVSITTVSAGSQGGQVTIADGGQSLRYTPPAGFVGVETFTYSVATLFGTDSAVVQVTVTEEDTGDGNLVRFRLETADAVTGEVITSVAPGAEFALNVYAQDLRANGMGVFAAYLDVEYDNALAAPAGNVTFGVDYPAGQVPSGGVVVGNPGELDEFGAFAGNTNDLGNAELLLYSIPMQAGSEAGQIIFSSNPADVLPLHEVLLGDIAQAIPESRIDYTSTTLTIGSVTANAFTNPSNRYDVDNNGFVTPRDALLLINDINSLGARPLMPSASAISTSYYLDVSADGNLSAIDVLQVINEINRSAAAAQAVISSSASSAAVDAVFDQLDDPDEEEDFLTLV